MTSIQNSIHNRMHPISFNPMVNLFKLNQAVNHRPWSKSTIFIWPLSLTVNILCQFKNIIFFCKSSVQIAFLCSSNESSGAISLSILDIDIVGVLHGNSVCFCLAAHGKKVIWQKSSGFGCHESMYATARQLPKRNINFISSYFVPSRDAHVRNPNVIPCQSVQIVIQGKCGFSIVTKTSNIHTAFLFLSNFANTFQNLGIERKLIRSKLFNFDASIVFESSGQFQWNERAKIGAF